MTKNGEQTGDMVRVSTKDGNLWGLFITWSRGVLMGGTNAQSVPPITMYVHPWGWI